MWPDVIVIGIIAAILALIVVRSIINKKKGKTSCSCGCGGCAFKDSCHSKTENK